MSRPPEAEPGVVFGGPLLFRILAAAGDWWVRPWVDIETERLDLALTTPNAMVVANHRSFADVAVALVLFRRIDRYPKVAVASDFFSHPVWGRLLRWGGALPLDRRRPRDGVRAVVDALTSGTPVIILPEGGLRSDPDDPTSVGEFKSGAARLAHRAGVPIYAVGIVGSDHLWPPGTRFPSVRPFRRRRVVALGADDLFWTTGDVRADTERLRSFVGDLLTEAAARWGGRPGAAVSGVRRLG